jgi:hypothetical protein
MQSNSTSKITLAVAELEDSTLEDENLDTKVKLYQDKHYQSLLTWKDTHGLHLDGQNYLWKDNALVVMENNNLRRGVLHHFHTSKTTRRPGIIKTIQLIQPHYWWPHMKDFVMAYIKGCATCQMNKINTHPTRPPLFPITSSSNLPFQMIAVDFITKLPLFYGNDTILMITDHNVSKVSIFLPCKETIDIVGVAELYTTHIFPHYRILLKVISDRDPHFDSVFTTDLCKLLEICQNISTTTTCKQIVSQKEQTNHSKHTSDCTVIPSSMNGQSYSQWCNM